MSDFDSGLFWPAFKATGLLLEASTVLPGCTEPTVFDVAYRRPDVNPLGMQSADHEIEYQHEDAPTLAEGAQVIIKHRRGVLGSTVIDEVLYTVRQAPRVELASGADGFFRCAYLTRETPFRG